MGKPKVTPEKFKAHRFQSEPTPTPEEDFSWFKGSVNRELLEEYVKQYPEKPRAPTPEDQRMALGERASKQKPR